MLNKNAMVDALSRKKTQGLDITITIGAPKGAVVDDDSQGLDAEDANSDSDAETKALGLAPDGTPMDNEEGDLQGDPDLQTATPNPDDANDKDLMHEALLKAGLGKGSMVGRKQAGMLSK